MVIWSEFCMGQLIDNDIREDALHFNLQSTWLIIMKILVKKSKN